MTRLRSSFSAWSMLLVAALLGVGLISPVLASTASDQAGPVATGDTAAVIRQQADPAQVTVLPAETPTDLTVTKSHEGPVRAGERTSFEVEVTNLGPSEASAPVTVTDVLPDEMSFVEASASGWDCDEDDGTVTCTLVDAGGEPVALAAGATAPALEIVASIDPSAGPGTLINTVSVDSPTDDPVLGNNTDSDTVTVEAEADLSLEKVTVGANTVLAGEQTSFEVRVTNDGPSSAANVSVVDTLPDGVELVSVSGTGWDCDDSAVPTLRCERAQVPLGDAPVITVEVSVLDGVAAGTVLTNVAVVSSDTPDPNEDNNEGSSTVTVATEPEPQPEADLSLEKVTVGDDPVLAGEQTSFEVRVTNAGPSTAADVSVVDTLPDGVELVSVSGTGWDCDDSTVPTLRCERAQMLPPGDAPVIRVEVRVLDGVAAGTVLTNAAVVSSDTPDPNEDNNEDSSTVTVATEPEPEDPVRPIPDRTQLIHACPDGEFPRGLFGDVAEDPFGASIDCLAWYGITFGVNPGEFQPGREVTRGQMAMFLARLIEYSLSEWGEGLPAWDGTSRFSDVRPSVTAAEAINVLSSPEIEQLLGIQVVAGGTDGRYRPNAPVSRQQMATFLARTLRGVAQFSFAQMGLTDDPIDRGECPPFLDGDDISAVHADNVDLICEFGITAGRVDGTYGPGFTVNRQQMAAFLMRTQDVFVEFELSVPPTARTGIALPSSELQSEPEPEPEPDPVLAACQADGLLVELLRVEPVPRLDGVDVEVAGRMTVVADAPPDVRPRIRVSLLAEDGGPYRGELTPTGSRLLFGDGSLTLRPGLVTGWSISPSPFPLVSRETPPAALRIELADLRVEPGSWRLETRCDFEVALDLTR